MQPEFMMVRTVRLNNNRYMKVEDVVELLLAFGESEETDVRDRLTQLARNILKTGADYVSR